MKLTATELSTLITALDDDIRQAAQVEADNLSPGSVERAKGRAATVKALRDKLKTELSNQLKKLRI